MYINTVHAYTANTNSSTNFWSVDHSSEANICHSVLQVKYSYHLAAELFKKKMVQNGKMVQLWLLVTWIWFIYRHIMAVAHTGFVFDCACVLVSLQVNSICTLCYMWQTIIHFLKHALPLNKLLPAQIMYQLSPCASKQLLYQELQCKYSLYSISQNSFTAILAYHNFTHYNTSLHLLYT